MLTVNATAPRTSGRLWQPAACPIPMLISVALGCALRFYHLGYKPLWEDEGWTFQVAVTSQKLVDMVGHDPHPYSYYYLYHLLAHWIAGGDALLRLPSALASAFALLLWPVCLAMTSIDRRVQKWGVLLMAVLPLNIQMAQEARAYAITQFLGMALLAAYLWARLGWPEQSGSLSRAGVPWCRLSLLAFATALSCHIDGFGLAIPAVLFLHAVWEAIFRKRKPAAADLSRKSPGWIVLSLAIGGACAVPYLSWRLTHLLGEVHALAVVHSPVPLLAERLVAASPFGLSPGSVPLGLPPHLTIALLGGGVALGFAASQVVPPQWIDRSTSVLFSLHLLIPLITFLIMSSATGSDMLEKRYFIVAVPGLVVLLTIGWLNLARYVPGLEYALLLAIPLIVSVMWLRQSVARSSSDWRTLVRKIAPEIRADDGFVHEAFLNYPLYAIGPLRSYAWRAGMTIDDSRCADYRTTLTEPGLNVSLRNAGEWPSAAEQERIEAFVHRSPSGRVWTLASDFSRSRMLDLSSDARLMGEYEATGLKARLWRIEPEVTTTQPVTGPAVPASRDAGGSR